ncbi:MAG: hypothetical protein GIW95_11795 [Candidatus Eremiobacteraeota bacterium]|nr:hypothetical protein [Candidatus Eremiobacteraeota bacterium]
MDQITEPIRAERLVPTAIGANEFERLSRLAPHAAGFAFFGTAIRVRFSDAAAAGALSRRYAAFASNDAPVLDLVAVNEGARSRFALLKGPAYVWEGPLHSRGLEFLADAIAGDAYFTALSPYQSFHSAAVAVDGVAVAITAASEGGKTTTALACARRDMPLYSDEWCVLDGNAVQPFPRAMNVRPGSLALLASEMPEHPLSRRAAAQGGRKWRDVAFTEAFGHDIVVPKPAPLAAIFFITARGARAHAVPLDAGSAVSLLLRAPFRSADKTRRLSHAIALLSTARPYALTLGTPDQTACAIRDVIRSSAGMERCA